MSLWLYPAVAFAAALIATPVVAGFLRERGVLGRDLHKETRPQVPELVGISVLASFSIALTAAYLQHRDPWLLLALAAVMLVGLLGVLDHYRPLSPREKILGLALVGLGYSTMSPGDHGYAFLILAPLLFMAACNFTNMLAGLNGLEIGVGAIAAAGVASVAYLNGSMASFLIAASMGAALIAFLHYNRYPARVFPGDVGTLIIGAALFTALHSGGLYLAGAIIFLPYLMDAALKFLSAGVMSRQDQTPTVLKDGKLYPPSGGNLSLVRLLLRLRPMGEKQVVALIWGIEALFAGAAIAVEVAL
jgi:UDP-N-acetylglucosamine--dolichyl-phosphate N-acetylglucosaminephosphotransferase